MPNHKKARKPKFSDTKANKARRVAKQGDGSKGKPNSRRLVAENGTVTHLPSRNVERVAHEGVRTVISGGERKKVFTGRADSKRLTRILTGNVRHDSLYRSFTFEDHGSENFANAVLIGEGRTKNPKIVAEEMSRRYRYWLHVSGEEDIDYNGRVRH